MKSIQDLYRFYKEELMPDVEVLEEARKAVANKLYTVGMVIGALVLLVLGIMVNAGGRSFLFPIVIGVLLFGGAYYWFSREYKCDFKIKIIKRIVEFIDPGLHYEPHSCISQHKFTSSGIFRHRIDRYKGDDFVMGTLDKTKLEFSELHAEYITRDSKGRTQHHTIFKGLFFIADFNKHFKGATYVLPDVAERMLGGLGTMFQKANKGRGELIKLEDVEFEKLFAVYGDDQIEARYILTHSLMERIVNFKKKTGKRISISFIGSNVNVAIPYSKDLFEPRIFRTLIDFEPIQEYYEDMALAISIVEDLNLNTRIWTKE